MKGGSLIQIWPRQRRARLLTLSATAQLKTYMLESTAQGAGEEKYSDIPKAEMKHMKNAVDKVFTRLWVRDDEPEKYRVG
jgi:hypothetical protein